jgi:hypothetical protein
LPAGAPRVSYHVSAVRRLAAPLLASVAVLTAPGVRAERWVEAWDPRAGAKPPMAVYPDGRVGPLRLDADFLEAAARRRAAAPGPAASGAAVQVGEILILQGDEEILDIDGARLALRWPMTALSRRVIERLGDHFHAITVWTTFEERSNNAEAYEQTVKIDVEGLGAPLRDMSRQYGSEGKLRSMVNMKRVGLRAAGDTRAEWERALATWGQEIGHRWMMFMRFVDRRTGRTSDALLGRGCSHYGRFVDSQASVHDGLGWRDNGDGTFTITGQDQRFGNLDLYGMGLLPPDEVPPFFLIDDIPGYRYPRCGAEYDGTRKPLDATIRGTRVDVAIEDVIEANGPRLPAADEPLAGERQDYFREAEVIVTQPGETADSPTVRRLAERLEKARLWWEEWMRAATGNRMVVCTKVTADCGDARSDVVAITLNAAKRAPAAGPLALEIAIENGGQRMATNVKGTVDLRNADLGVELTQSKDVGALAPGARRGIVFDVDLRRVACGSPVAVKAATQSDFHASRRRETLLVGTETVFQDGFESEAGWRTNPDGDDDAMGGLWERARPARDVLGGQPVQPDGARGGASAWVTGAAAGVRASLVREGRSTLESPPIDASSLREPQLRYWVAFAGVRAAPNGAIVTSPESRLVVLAGTGAAAVDAGAEAAAPGGWVEIDRLEDRNTKGWIERIAKIPAALTGRGRLRLRFVAEDRNPRQGGVEAAIDDVEIVSNVPACDAPIPAADAGAATGPADPGGCDCGLAGAPGRDGAAAVGTVGAVATLALVWGSRRRRRARAGSQSSSSSPGPSPSPARSRAR